MWPFTLVVQTCVYMLPVPNMLLFDTVQTAPSRLGYQYVTGSVHMSAGVI